MKAKYTVLMLALGLSVTAMAQETDDMYFNVKDRLAQTESNQASMAVRYAQYDQQAVSSNPVNPSDSYTGRGVNPEFSAQQKNGAELVQENPDYFLSSYKPKDINGTLYSGNASNYSNCGCGSSYSGMGYSGFGSPYGSMYSPYGGYYPYGGYSPYGGLSTMMSYGFGSYGSGWNMGIVYGMGSMYSNSYYGMYNPYSYYNPYSTTVVSSTDIGQVYGKRPIRSSSLNRNPTSTSASGIVAGTNGRTRDTRTSQSNYYDPSWKRDPSNFPTRSYGYGGRSSAYSPGSTNTGRSWGADNGRTRSSFDSFGSGSRSSMGSFGGTSSGGGGGRSRGRN